MKSKSPNTPKIHWGYLILTIILGATFYIGSLILYPEWKKVDAWVIILLVFVMTATVQFVANLRTVIEPSTSNSADNRIAPEISDTKRIIMNEKDCETLRRRLDAATKILYALEEKASRFTSSDIPVTLTIDLEDQRNKVAMLETDLKNCLGGKNEQTKR